LVARTNIARNEKALQEKILQGTKKPNATNTWLLE
jgi:hypothetical protein